MKTFNNRSNNLSDFPRNLFLSLLLGITTITSVNAQSLKYGFAFDLSNGATAETVLDLSLQGDDPRDLTFSNNGMRLFTVGSGDQEINQYNLTAAYDLSTATFAHSLDVSNEETLPEGIAIRNNGMDIYIVGVNSDSVYQYSMTSANDLSTASLSKKLKISDQQNFATDLAFNGDGSKMYIVGHGGKTIHQYNLSLVFDITTAVVSPNFLDISNEENTARGMTFGDSGRKLFVIGSSGREVNQYSLSTAYDISTASHELVFDVQTEDNGPNGVVFRPNGTEMFMVGIQGDDITKFNLDVGGFEETAANDGAVSGDVNIQITGETFTNAGSTLTYETDYTIINNPEGLVPTLTVAADGLSAVLTYAGKSEHHFETHDINGLIFTFMNSAFSGGNASAVVNATNKNSQRRIDYLDNAVLTYGKGFDFSGTITKNTQKLNVESQQASVQGVTISEDGTRLFVTGGPFTNLNKVSQWSLSNPYETITGVTYDDQIGVGPQDQDPMDLEFSPDGKRLYILGGSGRKVLQYDVNTPYDITGVVTPLGTGVNIFGQESLPTSLTFSSDGLKMFVLGATDLDVNQYTLHVPFDITKGVVFDGNPFSVASQTPVPEGLAFNETGTRMFIATRTEILQYSLESPFNVTTGVTYDNVSYSISEASLNAVARGFKLNKDGSKLYVAAVADGPDFVRQHNLIFNNNFTEDPADNGMVNGDTKITISGDTFVNAGGALDPGTHFSFSNLPMGLIPLMAVSADGHTITMTLLNSAIANREVDGIEDLEITFTDAAFTNSNASQVANAVNASTGSSISFTGETTLELQPLTLEQLEGDFFLQTNFTFAVARDGDVSGPTSVDYAVTGDVDATDFFNSIIPSGRIDFIGGQTIAFVDLPVSGDQTIEPDENFVVTLSNPTNQAIITTASATGIIINDDNNAPVLDNPIADLDLDEGFMTHTVDLTNVFSDADGHALAYMVSSTNAIATLQIVGSELRITEGANGITTITITADDGFGGNEVDQFVLTVLQANTAPVIDFALADEVLTEGFGTKEIDLDDVFKDADGDPLTLSAISDNTAVVTVSVSGNFLTLTEVANGTAEVTVTANDGRGGTVLDVFDVTIAAPNTAPEVANPISDQNLIEGFSSVTIDISNVFSDSDGDILIYSTTNGDDAVATISLSDTDLIIAEVGIGTTTVTVIADDRNGGLASDEFEISIAAAPNNAPIVLNTISDKDLTAGFTTSTVDLENVFSDADNDVLTFSATSSNSSVATTSISDNELTITEVGVGTTIITVTADDGKGGTVSDEFTVAVSSEGNNAPVVANALNDQSLTEGFTSTNVDLTNVFSDADGDALALTATSSDESVATISISSTNLTVTEVGVGTTTIALTANDGNGGSVSDEFEVTISSAVNNAPIVSSPISDQNVDAGFASLQIDLKDVFTDADSDDLTLTASSSDEAVVTVAISGDDLTIKEVDLGTSTITITADDGNGGTISETFDVTVAESTVLGLEDSIEINVYPNPASDYIMIDSPGIKQAVIFDQNGKIQKTQLNLNRIDITKLMSGVYMIRFSTNNGNTVWSRFIKR